jgi:hypothetical protein
MNRRCDIARSGSLVCLIPVLLLGAGCASESITVDDGDTGIALSASAWEDRTFVMDLRGFVWTEPSPEVQTAIGDFAPPLLLSVGSCTSEQCSVRIGTLKDDGTQELCSPTVQTLLVSGTPGQSQIGPVDLPLFIQSPQKDVAVLATAHDFTISDASIYGNGTTTEDRIVTTMDVRELYPAFTLIAPTPSADLVCAAFEAVGGCQPCADGAPYCFTLVIEQLSARELVDFTMVDVDAATLPAECPSAG